MSDFNFEDFLNNSYNNKTDNQEETDKNENNNEKTSVEEAVNSYDIDNSSSDNLNDAEKEVKDTVGNTIDTSSKNVVSDLEGTAVNNEDASISGVNNNSLNDSTNKIDNVENNDSRIDYNNLNIDDDDLLSMASKIMEDHKEAFDVLAQSEADDKVKEEEKLIVDNVDHIESDANDVSSLEKTNEMNNVITSNTADDNVLNSEGDNSKENKQAESFNDDGGGNDENEIETSVSNSNTRDPLDSLFESGDIEEIQESIETNADDFPYDPNKRFNDQQDPVFFPGDSLMSVLEKRKKEYEENADINNELISESDLGILSDSDISEQSEIDEGIESDNGKKKKKSKIKVSKEKLIKKGFPKIYFDPTDAEVNPKTGETEYFYNVEKTLRKNRLLFITKIIPLRILVKMTYDKSLFDAYADKQHAKAIKLNNMSAAEQYQYELRSKTIKIIVTFALVFLIALRIIFSAVPNNNYGKAIELFNSKKWALSMEEFKNVGDYKDSKIYYKYADAKKLQGEKKYDDAIAQLEDIKDFGNRIDKDIYEEINEMNYYKGINFYTERKFKEAIDTLSKIAKYKDSENYINKSKYAIAEELYDSSKYQKALKIFFDLGKFSDSEDRARSIANELYGSAMAEYNKKEYKKAAEKFELLSNYGYKNSKDMVNQTVYRHGLDYYGEGNYENARKLFTKIDKFKDSDALFKEATYNLGKAKYGDSVEDSLEEFLKIRDYRDVPKFLNNGVFTLYGEWKIVEMNGQASDEAIFSFNKGGLLKSDSSILYAALSTKENPIPYKWDGKKHVAMNGNYSIETKKVNSNTIKAVFTDGDNQAEFTCVQEKDFLTLTNKKTDNSIEKKKEMDELTQKVQDYIWLKTDGNVPIEQERVQ